MNSLRTSPPDIAIAIRPGRNLMGKRGAQLGLFLSERRTYPFRQVDGDESPHAGKVSGREVRVPRLLISDPPSNQFQPGLGRPVADSLPVAGKSEFTNLRASLVGERYINKAHGLFRGSAARACDACDAETDGSAGSPADAFGERLGDGF